MVPLRFLPPEILLQKQLISPVPLIFQDNFQVLLFLLRLSLLQFPFSEVHAPHLLQPVHFLPAELFLPVRHQDHLHRSHLQNRRYESSFFSSLRPKISGPILSTLEPLLSITVVLFKYSYTIQSTLQYY